LGVETIEYQRNERLVQNFSKGKFFTIILLKYKEIIELGGESLLRVTNYSLPQLLVMAYPEHSWEFQIKSKSAFYKKSQTILKSTLKLMLAQEGFQVEYFFLTFL
jgi:hypothetical protein